MREIKFRVWDGESMREWLSVTKKPAWQELDVNMPETYSWEVAMNVAALAVMQYTGLKDVNGTEVYEGDIVRCSRGCPHEVKWFMDNGGTYLGGMPGFNFGGMHRNGGTGYAWTGEEEVIGNIYENPELLASAT